MQKIFLFILLLASGSLRSQNLYDQKWLIDHYNLFDFSSGDLQLSLIVPPVWLGPGDYTTSICNKYGELQFYSGGCFVGNRLHEIMENGDNINAPFAYTGWCNYGDLPMSHNNTILPYPSDSTKYLLFNLDMSSNGLLPQHLYYHVVDMTKDGELGAVVEKKKIAVSQGLLTSGSLTAVQNSNGHDWWVVVPKHYSNCYFIVPVTDTGVGTLQEQCLGLFFNEHDGGGQAVFSPDGTKYTRVEADNGLVLMDFDASTGQFSNPVELTYEDEYNFSDGACFSGNSRYLYVTATTKVYQFDTEAADIQASRQLVGKIDPDTLAQGMGALASSKLAPNGKIYIVTRGLHRYISSIERPNCPSTLCNFQAHKIMLPDYNYSGINNLPHFRVPEQTYDCEPVGTTEAAGEAKVKISPNPASDFILLTTSEGGSLDIFTPEGRFLEHRAFGMGESRLPIALRPGLYFFQFRFETGGITVKKAVIQH